MGEQVFHYFFKVRFKDCCVSVQEDAFVWEVRTDFDLKVVLTLSLVFGGDILVFNLHPASRRCY